MKSNVSCKELELVRTHWLQRSQKNLTRLITCIRNDKPISMWKYTRRWLHGSESTWWLIHLFCNTKTLNLAKTCNHPPQTQRAPTNYEWLSWLGTVRVIVVVVDVSSWSYRCCSLRCYRWWSRRCYRSFFVIVFDVVVGGGSLGETWVAR